MWYDNKKHKDMGRQVSVCLDNPCLASCGGIFRDDSRKVLRYFAVFLKISNASEAKLVSAINAIEQAYNRNWQSLRLECDSSLVIQVVNNPHIVPQELLNKWIDCMFLTKLIHFKASHIYIEKTTSVQTPLLTLLCIIISILFGGNLSLLFAQTITNVIFCFYLSIGLPLIDMHFGLYI